MGNAPFPTAAVRIGDEVTSGTVVFCWLPNRFLSSTGYDGTGIADLRPAVIRLRMIGSLVLPSLFTPKTF